jgi:hypothetical protein
MTEDEAKGLKVGDEVEYYDGQRWHWVEVIAPYGPIECWPHVGVKVHTGTYGTVAQPKEMRF